MNCSGTLTIDAPLSQLNARPRPFVLFPAHKICSDINLFNLQCFSSAKFFVVVVNLILKPGLHLEELTRPVLLPGLAGLTLFHYRVFSEVFVWV